MRVEYELNVDDLIAAAMRTYARSVVLRRRILFNRFVTTLTLVGISFGYAIFCAGTFGLFLVAPLAAILGAVVWVALPHVYRDQQLRFLNEFYRIGESRKLVGHYSLTMSDAGVKTSSPNSESLFPWSAVNDLVVAKGHCYIDVPGGTIVVPRRSILEDQFQQFSQSLEQYKSNADFRSRHPLM